MALCLYLFWTVTSAAWVWLALAPVAESAPPWLVQTRDVCFGTLENGLPDVHGWISLAAPLPMLVALVVLMGGDLRSQLARLSRSPVGFALTLTLLTMPGITLGYAALRVAQAPRLAVAPEVGPLPQEYPMVDEPCPDFQLQDQGGRLFGPKQLLGQVTIVTFAYAHCQTVCPGLLENLRQAAAATHCKAVVVTLDPRRDTCGSLEGLARHWELPAGSVMLGGEVDEVEKAIAAFGVPIDRDLKTGDITHPALVFVFDSRARLRYRFTSPSRAWLEEAAMRSSAGNTRVIR